MTAPKSSSRCLPRRPTKTSAWPTAASGAGTAVFSAVNVIGRNLGERGAGELGVEPLGVGLDLGQLGHQYSVPPRTASNTSSTPSKVPWWVISSSTLPPTRSLPIMKAVWADRSPRPMAAAVS